MLHNILLLSRWQKALQLLLLIKRFKLFLQVLDNPMHIIKQYPFCKPLSCPLFFLLLRHLTMYPDMTYRKLLADILQRVLNVSGFMLLLTAIEWLATLVCSILCLYTACMIGHQFKQHFALVGIAAFVGLNVVQNRLVALLPYTNNTVGLDMVVILSGDTWQVTTNRFYLRAVLLSLLADAVLCGVYFAATNWLMKNKLDLD
mgnify:FL=1